MTVASTIDGYLRLPLEENKCLRFLIRSNTEKCWLGLCRFLRRYEEETAPSDYARKALLCVARRHLTPPPSSTNVERLFSVGGLTATDHRASLSGEKLDQILFLRENALMANFNLGWQQGVTTCGLSSLASFLKILSSKRVCCVFRDIRDKNAVNEGFWSKTAVFSLPATKVHC